MEGTLSPKKSISLSSSLVSIRDRAQLYFSQSIEVTAPASDLVFMVHPIDYWEGLPKAIKEKGSSITTELAELAKLVGPAIRRSPLLTEADEREAGYAIKGMRAALRFRRFQHWETEVIHDEGTVLGVQPERESIELSLHPSQAGAEFENYADLLQARLDITNPNPDDSHEPPSSISIRPIAAGYRPGTGFIMMWMDGKHPELTDVSNTVKRCFTEFGIKAVRSDDIEHEDVITQRILDEIKTAEFLFADLTGERPSVYYEIGYAHALGRRIIMYRKAESRIHFDLAAYNCPEYQNLSELEDKLMKRLESVTGKLPKKKT